MIAWNEETALWWPSYDKQDRRHALRFINNRISDSDLAVARCKNRRFCVQAGGMIGLWPQRLARSFDAVLTFEPDAACLAALRKNVSAENVVSKGKALGAAAGPAVMRRGSSSGSWRIRADGDRAIDVVTIDSFNLFVCDAIILDVEGHEIEALRGAANTIARFSPVIMIEEWHPPTSEAFMRNIGYRAVGRVHSDAIYERRQ